ncbi:MAG: hypothetical protein IJA10_08175 [Lachnospiraceae bacterium]|nr:hypothetical protein [Lachnospiraceae bacterium]
MKKNNSKKLILAAVLFFSGGLMLPLGNQEIVNAAQEEQEYQKSELLENEKEMTDWEQEIEIKEEERKKETEGGRECEEKEGEIKEEERIGEIEKAEEKKGEEVNAEIEKEAENGESEEKENKDENLEKEGEESINEENKDENSEKEGEEESYDEKKNELEEQEANQYEEKVEEKDIKEEALEENVIEIMVNESCNVNSEKNSLIDSETLTEHFLQSDEIPENVIVQQIILSPENLEQSSVVVTEQIIDTEFGMEQESQTSAPGVTIMEPQEIVEQANENLAATGEDEKEIELSIKEALNVESEKNSSVDVLENIQSEKDSSIEVLEDVKAPVVTIENLVSSPEKKELRFYYRMDDENLVEYQIKVFFTSGGKEELIWQESNKTEGELSFEKEGNYLVCLYAKDSSGNESRTYQNYSLGSFELELEELNQFENQEVELEDMEILLEDVFEGSNVATYQLYINGEQYKGDTSQIPEGKCILTVEMEDTHGNFAQKTMEVIAANTKTKGEMTEEEIEEGDKTLEEEQIQYKENKLNEKVEGIETDEKNENEKKDSGIPIEAAGILGSLISGMLILFRRIKH